MFADEVARPERFELPTPRFVVWCSIQLSYGRLPFRKGKSRAPGRGTRLELSASCPAWQGSPRGSPGTNRRTGPYGLHWAKPAAVMMHSPPGTLSR